MPGAARLACAAARRAGAGMVTLATEAPMILPEAGLIVRATPLAELLQDKRRKVFACGPGLGPGADKKLTQLIAAGVQKIVADADALTACAGLPEKLRGTAVITPHEGEFARVFGPLRGDRLAAVRAAAQTTGAVTVLKGADTVIAAPDGRAVINDNAPPFSPPAAPATCWPASSPPCSRKACPISRPPAPASGCTARRHNKSGRG